MCSPTELATKVRYKLRDFGHYFEVPYTAAPIYTLRLPHPLVEPDTFVVWLPDGTIVSTGWTLDARNGIVKISDPNVFADGVGCSGYFYEWFLNEDLEYAAGVTSNQHLYDRGDQTADDFAPVECDAIATGAAMGALWSLAAELAVDIDVSQPEGVMIPASQRFRQVIEMATSYGLQYKAEAAMLGVGLDKIEQFWLRRTAYLTNRYVPIIKGREVDDPRWPTRVLLPIPAGTMAVDGDVEVQTPEPYSGVGWLGGHP